MTTTPDSEPAGGGIPCDGGSDDQRGTYEQRGTYDDMGNLAFNALRIGRLLDLLGTLAEPAAPRRLLVAGCGTGWLTRALASFGHQVDGIDSDAAAVAACRGQSRADGRDSYAMSGFDTWAPAYLYDAVVSVDVIFRFMQDPLGEASVVNLASLVRSGGRLVLPGHDQPEVHGLGEIQVSGVRRNYVELLAAEGLACRRFVPLGFRDNDAGLHVFDRIA